MNGYCYEVHLDGIPYAREMHLEAALALVEALFTKWFAEPDLSFEIRRVKYDRTNEAD